tara:strand:- start:4681 stop:5049 length:369 start_codon:yes stop_codon:yes gene_type:complete
MLKTNSKKYQANFKNYILSVIDGEDLPSETMSDKEKINFVMDRFTNEHDHEYNRREIPNNQERFGDWLQGGALNIPMNYDQVLNLAKKLLETDKLKNENRIIEKYYSFMALQIIRLNEKLNK